VVLHRATLPPNGVARVQIAPTASLVGVTDAQLRNGR